MALRLLEHGREDVADVALRPAVRSGRAGWPSADTRRNAVVCSGSCSTPPAEPLDRFVEVGAERAPQRRQVRAAGGEDALAVGIVRERVEQVLERHVARAGARWLRGTRCRARRRALVKTRSCSSLTRPRWTPAAGGRRARAGDRPCRPWSPPLPTGRCRRRRGRSRCTCIMMRYASAGDFWNTVSRTSMTNSIGV